MGENTKIEWTEATWNPVTGCTKISPGCKNCYAERMTKRLKALGQAKYGAGFGKVVCHPGTLDAPLKWKKPRMVFVNSISDLFHRDVPFDFIDSVFAVMACSPRHTFQVLTKRPERMREYLASERKNNPGQSARQHSINMAAGELQLDRPFIGDRYLDSGVCDWPPPNVWLGTTAETQEYADKRIPELLKCPAALRFVSLEPLLGPIDLRCALGWEYTDEETGHRLAVPAVDWVIVGGESGPQARPCQLEWILDIVQQCKAAGVPCFVKQLGAQSYLASVPSIHDGWGRWAADVELKNGRWRPQFKHPKGGDPAEWPEELRVQQFPEVTR